MKSIAFALAWMGSAAGLALVPSAANASVSQLTANGFVVRHLVEVTASPEETWAVLVKPSVWWDSDHTWSGSAANLTLDARAGGCFCEVLPSETSPKAAPLGGVEHMRVVYVERGRALRMVGGLGPLQGEGVSAALTVQLKADGKGRTKLLLEYVVGGFARTPFEKLAPSVDGMLGGQLKRLTEKLGGTFASAFPAIEPGAEATLPPAEPTGDVSAADEPAPADADAAPRIAPVWERPPVPEGPLVGR